MPAVLLFAFIDQAGAIWNIQNPLVLSLGILLFGLVIFTTMSRPKE